MTETTGWAGRRRRKADPEDAPQPSGPDGLSYADGVALAAALRALASGEPLPDVPAGVTRGGQGLLVFTARTAERVAEAEAKRERESLQVARMLEATNEGVYVQDTDGLVTFVNGAGSRMLGRPKEELLGRSAHDIFHATADCPIEAVLHDALPEIARTEFRTTFGVVPMNVNVAPVVQGGIVAEIVCVFSDATERVKRELAQSQLLASVERALNTERSLSQQKADFVSTVSHELRTPLTSVLGYLELIEEGVLGDVPEKIGDKLAIINRNAKRLLSQVEALLLVSRIESGAMKPNMTDLDLRKVVTETVDALRPQAAAKGLRLDVQIPDDVPILHADPAQIDRAVLNLLSNAVKFTPSGGEVGLTVTAFPRHVEVEVADTGMGIPAAEQHRLFEKFFRSSISQKQATQGTGLGLAIVKAIIEEHGGRISVASEEGVGTTFAFSLPVPQN